jgi:parallel beta-helix repeat protein
MSTTLDKPAVPAAPSAPAAPDSPAAPPLVRPTNGMIIRTDTRLEPGVYFLPDGLTIDADGVTLDGNGAMLIGRGREKTGVRCDGRSGVTIRNLRLREYCHGIAVRRGRDITIEKNHITSTAEVPANTIFLDIWLDAAHAYGGAILLEDVSDSTVADNDIQHQMCGLLTYGCRKLAVRRNLANFNSGYGIHLYETCDSVFEQNWADCCCRYEPRDRDPAKVSAVDALGHMGADATGFLIVRGSCRNVFRSNYARLGGDGFFLAGLSPHGDLVGCDDNLFEANDGSLSPNIAFEATFSRRNVFRNNKADRCNYGFWLGFSSEYLLEGNKMRHNRQAGIAVENGAAFRVIDNDFQHNHIAGCLLWSKLAAEWHEKFPSNRTIHGWTIEGNRFTRNGTAIAILADKDHGIRPMPAETCGKPEIRPRDNAITRNDIQDNRVGVHLFRADRTTIEKNTISRNVEADVRQDDATETIVRNNLGLVGGYL